MRLLPPLKGAGGVDLPGLKGAPELPALKGAPELPAPKGGAPELPALKGAPELPAPKGGAPELPALKGGAPELPALKGGAPELPALKGGAPELPALKGGAPGVPVAKHADLPAMKADDDDLFGGAGSKDDDDLFAAPGTKSQDDDDLFGSGSSDDDLFAPAPAAKKQAQDDDLFGPPVASKPVMDDEDLFGSGSKDDDIFISNRAVKTDDDDFLGGDAGFSFLDDGPPPAADDEWGNDLFADPPAGAPVTGNATPASTAKNAAELDDWGDDLIDRTPRKPKAKAATREAEHDPFRPASTGIREPEPQLANAQVDQAQAADEDRKRGPMMIGVGILVAALVGGGGYAAYTMFAGGEEGPEKPVVVKEGPVTVDMAAIAPDNYSDLSTLIDRARKGQLQGDNNAKLLVVEALLLSRYKDDEVLKDATKRAAGLKNAEGGWNALARGGFEAQAGNGDAARAYLEPLLGGDGDQVYLANLLMGIADVVALERDIKDGNVTLQAVKPSEDEAVAADADAGTPDAGTEADAGADAAQAPPVAQTQKNPLVTRATIALRGAADANPSSPLPDYWLGRMAELNDAAEAEKHFSAAIKKSPTHVASHVALANLLYARGELKDALAQVEQVNGEMAPSASSEERARALHVSGQIYVAQRQSDAAIDAFTKALKVDPTRTETLRALALEYESAKKYKEALNFFTTNKNLGQREPEVMLGIVRSHIGLEQWGAAIDQLEEAQKLFPQDARFPFYLGRLNRDRGDFVQAQKAFERAVEIDPKLLTAQTALAQLTWRMDKDLIKGESYIKKVVENPDLIDSEVALEVARYYHQSDRRELAAQWYRESLRLDPNFWEARLSLSKLLLEENKFADAQALLEKARAEGVQDVRLSAYLADAYRQAGEYDRAIDEINKVIAQFPKSQEYIYIRGRIHFDRGNYETALKDFSKAYDIDPRFHDAYFYVGRTAFEQGDVQQALKIFRHVLDYQPNRGSYRFYMGRALEIAGRESQALDEYRKATAVDAAYGVENPAVYIYRGRLMSKLGYAAEGRKDIERALELAPDMVEALLAMGETSFNDKDYPKAIENLNKALEKQPEHAEGQYMLGMALTYAGRQREGAQRLQLAVKQGYNNPEVFRTLGYLYKDLGQRNLAVESFEKYLQSTQDKEVPMATRRELLRQIKELGG
ncbi:MAG: tetratricopeptide repeat protein [bacterium]